MNTDRLRPAELFRVFRCDAETQRGYQCTRKVIWFAWTTPRPLHPRCWQHEIALQQPAAPIGAER